MLLVQAGTPVQSMIDQLVPLLEKGDIIIGKAPNKFASTSP
jgi:6-phosphogluconate dehydrogenase